MTTHNKCDYCNSKIDVATLTCCTCNHPRNICDYCYRDKDTQYLSCKCGVKLCRHCYKNSYNQKCSCGEYKCTIIRRATTCHFCKRNPVHVKKTSVEVCDYCATGCMIMMCCRCFNKIPIIDPTLVDIKQTLSNILCDPSKIVVDYWDNDFREKLLIQPRKLKNGCCGKCNKLIF
jgi:hypothetical protein